MNITKFIPWSFKIKSRYWVKKEKEIEADLAILFNIIDADAYDEARAELEILKIKWEPFY